MKDMKNSLLYIYLIALIYVVIFYTYNTIVPFEHFSLYNPNMLMESLFFFALPIFSIYRRILLLNIKMICKLIILLPLLVQ